MTDPLDERVRKLGGDTIRSIGPIARFERVVDNDAAYVEHEDMLAELCEDNQRMAARAPRPRRRGPRLRHRQPSRGVDR